jgi:hypothetical protein
MQEYPHRSAARDNDSRNDLGQQGSQLEFAPNLGVVPHARAGRFAARENAEFRWRFRYTVAAAPAGELAAATSSQGLLGA